MERLTLEKMIHILKKVDSHNAKVTGKSLNHVPEYYINVQLGERLNKLGYGIEFEMPTSKICEYLEISDTMQKEAKHRDEALRNGQVDLVVKTKEKSSIRHLVELKRGSKVESLKKDVERILFYATCAEKRSIRRGFIVFVTHVNPNNVAQKLEIIAKTTGANITFDFLQSKLNNTKEYKGILRDKKLFIWCCEVKQA